MHRTDKIIMMLGLLLVIAQGCDSTERPDQELMGRGIVRGTLGAHPEWQASVNPTQQDAVIGQVLKLEGGAYVIQEVDGTQRRLPLDENTRIDRPAHVGDRIQAWIDDRDRAVLIRNVDHE